LFAESSKEGAMAGEKPGGPGGRRPVPTIELTASEVANEPAKQPDSASSASAAPEDTTEPPEASAAEDYPPTPPRNEIWRSRILPWSLGAAAAAVLILVSAWAATMWSARDDTILLAARLAAVEVQLQELAARPVPNVDRNVDDLSARIGRAEAALGRPPAADPALAARLAVAETATKWLTENLAALNRRIEDVAAAAREARGRAEAAAGQNADQSALMANEQRELEAMAGKIAALEQATKATQDEVAKRASAGDRAARLAVTAAALQAAVERGEPFAAQLDAAKPLAADAGRLAPLEPFARTGVPSIAALSRELQGLTPALLPTGAGKPQGGFLDRLQTNAERLVRIRPIGEAAGDDPGAIVARIENKAAQMDLAGALAELRKLPAELRAAAQEWIRKAEGRTAAVDASRRFAAEAMEALGRS
jgi:hypothetical protein